MKRARGPCSPALVGLWMPTGSRRPPGAPRRRLRSGREQTQPDAVSLRVSCPRPRALSPADLRWERAPPPCLLPAFTCPCSPLLRTPVTGPRRPLPSGLHWKGSLSPWPCLLQPLAAGCAFPACPQPRHCRGAVHCLRPDCTTRPASPARRADSGCPRRVCLFTCVCEGHCP